MHGSVKYQFQCVWKTPSADEAFISGCPVASCRGWGCPLGPTWPWCRPSEPRLVELCCSRCSSSSSGPVRVRRWCCRCTWPSTRRRRARWQRGGTGLWQVRWCSGGGSRHLEVHKCNTVKANTHSVCRSVCLSAGLTHVSVSHHALGPASQVGPHVGHQLVELLHRKWHVVLVCVAVVRQRLGDAFSHRPQSLRDGKIHWTCQCKYLGALDNGTYFSQTAAVQQHKTFSRNILLANLYICFT